MQNAKINLAPGSELFNYSQAAAYLGVTTRTIQRYVRAGLIPAYHPTANFVRIRKSGLDEFLSKGSTLANKAEQ